MKKVISLGGILAVLILCIACNIPEKEKPAEAEQLFFVETEKPTPSAEQIMNALVRDTPGWDRDVSDHTIKVTYEEAQMLLRLASAEASNQGEYGMYLVMQVVMNRVLDDSFPGSVEEVIFQDGQFETVSNGTYYTVEIPIEAHLALAELEKNYETDKSIIAFETSVNGRTLEKYFSYSYTSGGHDFYITKKN